MIPAQAQADALPRVSDAGPDAWAALPEAKRAVAQRRYTFIRSAWARLRKGASRRCAAETLLLHYKLRELDADDLAAGQALGRNGKCPSLATVTRWLAAFEADGILGLVSGKTGRQRTDYGWETRAVHLYNTGSKPGYATVAEWLRDEGHDSALDHRVTHFLKTLPVHKGKYSAGRLGPRLRRNTQGKYVERSTERLLPGDIYQGDGHTLDVYLAHPTGRRPWRAELTVWLDVASRYVVGFYLSEAESANSTLFALSHAITSAGHVPAMLHIDNGSGYVNKMMAEASTGFYDRLGISVMHSLPYNAKAKGQVERWFGTMERKLNARFDSYCGAEMSDEHKARILKRHEAGEDVLPTLGQWLEAFKAWLTTYHNTAHRGLGGKTPAEVWAGLDAKPCVPATEAMFWPRIERTIQRGRIRHENRWYGHSELFRFDRGTKVLIDYNLHDDRMVRVLRTDGAWICDAELVERVDYVPQSRIEEARAKRERAALKRLERKADEVRRRADLVIGADTVLEGMAELLPADTAPALGHEQPVRINDLSNDQWAPEGFDLLAPMLEESDRPGAATPDRSDHEDPLQLGD